LFHPNPERCLAPVTPEASPPQELDQVLVQDWDEEAEEDKATAKEEVLIRVQPEIERLQQEQESIMRRQTIAQRAGAHRQHIN
jgi:hypothetical protein